MHQTQKKHPMTSSNFGGEPLTQPQMNTTCSPGLQKEKSPAYIHAESNKRLNFDSDEPESQSESEEELHESGGVDSGVKRTKFRRRSIVKNWPEHVKFDEEEEVVAFDIDGTRHLVKGSVQPRDVWNDAPRFRYFAQFNEFNQPLHKGGSILAHFLLPDGKEMRNAILKRIGKAWKNHRYALKKDYFDSVEKTREQNYASILDGITTQNWSFLVDYWLSSDAKKMSELGKASRASQVLVRKSGAKSFANRRAILKKQKGDFSELEFFKSVYSEGDGSFKEGTTSRQFVEDAIKKVQESLDKSSSCIPKVDIENEVFNQLMYQGEIPKRPLNYGFGVKQSDIFGVEGHLRKEGSYYVNNSDMEVEKLKVALLDMKKQNEDLAKQNQILNTKFDAVGSMMAQVLKATRSGNVSSEVIDNAIQLLDSQLLDLLHLFTYSDVLDGTSIIEDSFEYVDAPIVRIAGVDVPMPYAPFFSSTSLQDCYFRWF
uniref:Transposase, Ptta/En/Spm, plant n=1 Tax=Chenopodium quinoa TaxID=63459 RepID=A0A803N9Y4_CHEQI